MKKVRVQYFILTILKITFNIVTIGPITYYIENEELLSSFLNSVYYIVAIRQMYSIQVAIVSYIKQSAAGLTYKKDICICHV